MDDDMASIIQQTRCLGFMLDALRATREKVDEVGRCILTLSNPR
jgi:hypothetical protein